jgi:hypothetical protein
LKLPWDATRLKGNLNGAKNPWVTFWKKRALPAEDCWILRFIDPYIGELMSDKPDATAGELRMMEIASAARVCWMLAISKNNWKVVSSFMQARAK